MGEFPSKADDEADSKALVAVVASEKGDVTGQGVVGPGAPFPAAARIIEVVAGGADEIVRKWKPFVCVVRSISFKEASLSYISDESVLYCND